MKHNANYQKVLKERYAAILAAEVWHNDQKMVDYCVKKTGYVVELGNGDIIAIDKPSIEKSFCFGYSDSRYDTEDYDRANAMADHARKSEDYFIEQNMAGINQMIEQLEANSASDALNGVYSPRPVFRVCVPYSGQPADSKLKALHSYPYWDEQAQKWPELKGDDRQRVIDGYKVVRADFEKRLNTYLKRYGLSKVRSWSYWQDA